MGSCLGRVGRQSDDPAQPSLDVGTVKLFENDQIRVWDMVVRPGGRTGYHKHQHDYIFLQIGDGYCRAELVDELTGDVSLSEQMQLVPSKSCHWRAASAAAPQIHQLHNASAT